jgi:methionyl-tRNA synthetase
MSEQPKKFYLTTPIYYVNARPHIGHAYTTIVADVLARRHRLLGPPTAPGDLPATFFLTGTDEHGQKIERSAAAAGIPPQEFADQVSAQFRGLWDRMGLTYDRYIRTTDDRHKRGVQKLFADLYNRGFIYLSTYTGSYCVSDEAFVDAPVGTPCPDCGRLLEEVTEENFFFKLSEFQLPLLNLIESNDLLIEPSTARNEVLSFLRGNVDSVVREYHAIRSAQRPPPPLDELYVFESIFALAQSEDRLRASSVFETPYVPGALKDLSISRSSFTWGIPVPESVQKAAGTTQNHVIYVWLDALANYMTAIGYGSDAPADEAEFKKYWPADLHLVGKEITRFHCVYWPAFLLALNPALQPSSPPLPHEDVILSAAKDPRILPAAAMLPPEAHAAWAKQMLPKAVTAHGWLLFDNSKMSKSKGNIVRTETILEGFGALCPPSFTGLDTSTGSDSPTGLEGGFSPPAGPPTEKGALAPGFSAPTKAERDLFASDVLRYFLLREIPFGQDGTFSFDAMITRYNADLANGYGNLVSRTVSMIAKYFGATIPSAPPLESLAEIYTEESDGLTMAPGLTAGLAAGVNSIWLDQFDKLDFARALEGAWSAITSIDRVISDNAPWKLAAQTDEHSQKRLSAVLYTAADAIRIITGLLHPVLPFATSKVWAQLGLGDIEVAAANGELKNLAWGGLQPGTKLGPLAPIFPRADKGLAQIMIDMENPVPSPEPTSTTDPAAPPRSGASDPAGKLSVGGSDATTTHNGPTPSHTEVPASGIFAGAPAEAPAGPADASPQITIDDFIKVELRVAEIKVAERIPKADKLLRLEVDLGPAFPSRQILSGIAEWYVPEDLIGRRIIVITNLAPRKMRGLESHGMLLAASEEGGKPFLATVPEGVPVGTRLK